MSKNNLRGITLVRGPIWGIHSLTLIISWLTLIYERLTRNKGKKECEQAAISAKGT